jgi:hypothetical protein
MSYSAGETERIAGCEDEDNECDNEHHNQCRHADKNGSPLSFVEWFVQAVMTNYKRRSQPLLATDSPLPQHERTVRG